MVSHLKVRDDLFWLKFTFWYKAQMYGLKSFKLTGELHGKRFKFLCMHWQLNKGCGIERFSLVRIVAAIGLKTQQHFGIDFYGMEPI